MRPLTERDLETLNELWGCTESLIRRPMEKSYAMSVGFAPIEFGGSNGSHHGKTATKLVAHGFVEHKMRGAAEWGIVTTRDARGSKIYRATPAGVAALEAWRQLKRGEIIGKGPMKQKWGHTIPTTAYRPLTDAEIAERRLLCHLDMPK